MTASRGPGEPRSDEPWSNERLGAAYRARFGGAAPIGLAGDTVGAVRAGRPSRLRASSGPRLGWLGIAAVVAVVAVVGTGFALRFGLYPGGGTVTDGPPGLKTFTYGEIAFDFPAGWSLRDASVPFSGGSVIAVVGTLPVDPACGLGHVDINCYYEQRLEPGTISVVVGTGAYRGGTIFDPERAAPPTVRTTIAGMPALFSDRGRPAESYYLSDLDLTWEIAFPATPTNVYRIDVGIRGPGVEDYRRQAEALAASFRFVNPVPGLPTDAATAREVGRAAIAEAESGDRTMWELAADVPSWYSCFGDEADRSNDAFVATSPGGHLDPPVFAVCRWTIAPEGSAFWRLDLETDWSAGVRSGTVLETRWLTPDGASVAQTYEGDFPPTTVVEPTEEPTPPGSPDPNTTEAPTGAPDFSEVVYDVTGRTTWADVYDESGLMVAIRSARPEELDPLLDLILGGVGVTNPAGRPTELLLQWYGTACDISHTFTLQDRGRSISMSDRTTASCRVPAIQRGLVLTFSESIPADEVTIARHPPVIVDADGSSASESDDEFELELRVGRSTYRLDEAIDVGATFTYLGPNPSERVFHAASPIGFRIEEIGGTRVMGGGMDTPCLSTNVVQGSPVSLPFSKSGVVTDDPSLGFDRTWYEDPDLRLPAGRWRIVAYLWAYLGDCGGEEHRLEVAVEVTVEP